MKKKRLLAILLSLTLSMSMIMPTMAAEESTEAQVESQIETEESADKSILAEEPEEASASEDPIDASKWTVEDFEYTTMSQTMNGCDYTRTIQLEGSAIKGFSESGLKKVALNKNLVLPSVNDKGEKLIGVADNAFKNQGLTSVTFPEGMMVDYDDTVTHVVTRRGNFIIGASSFYGNELTELNLPEGVIAVMPSAFMNNKLASVSLPHTIWWIENASFAKNELPKVGFPKTCDFQLQIHAMAFAYNQIKSVRLPDYTEVVEKKAFYYNPGMEECSKEASEKEQSFGGVVYMYTDNPELANMERIHHTDRTVESQHSWHQKLIVGEQAAEDGAWTRDDFTYDGTVITGLSESGVAKRAENPDLVLPDKNPGGEYITEIADAKAGGSGLFATEEQKITSVILPEKLQKIGVSVFQNSGLTKVTFPNTLEEIGNTAF